MWMDPETERRLAAMIMDEASFLRREAERDGVAAYLAKPKIRGRANPQFLQATVRSVQQSNKIVEVNEMWRRRKVEVQYEKKARSKSRRRDSPRRHGEVYGECSPSSDRYHHRHESDLEDIGCDDGLKDEELEQFLNSRQKRGRGAVGSRMDEPGPYLPPQNGSAAGRAPMPDERLKNDWEERIYGPQAGPSVSGSHGRSDEPGTWKRMQREQSIEEGEIEEEEAGGDRRARRTDRKKKEKNRKQEKDSKKRKRQKLERSSKRRR